MLPGEIPGAGLGFARMKQQPLSGFDLLFPEAREAGRIDP